MQYIKDMKSGMLQVRGNGISLCKWSGAAAQPLMERSAALQYSIQWRICAKWRPWNYEPCRKYMS